MSERGERDRPEGDNRHLYGRRAYDQGPPPGTEERRAPASNGAPAGNGQPAEAHALQKSEPRALQKYVPEQQGHDGAPHPDADRRSKHQNDEAHDKDAPQGKDGAAEKHVPVKPHIRPGLPRLLLIGLIVALIVAALAAGLLFWRHHHRLAKESERRAHEVDRGPRVFVTTVRTEPGVREVTLPADVRGFSQATVYAKVSGYVKSISVDKGDVVKAGQLLGVLESPEVDQQVAGAEADLAVKKRTYERYKALVAKDFVSQQDFDTAQAQYEVAQATLRQARAMQAYETLRAPFAGTVTARYVDPGALVPAAAGSTQSAVPLVDIADLKRLRILLFVQQDAAPFIHAGDLADIAVDERPDLKLKAPITRVSSALDPRSRTMLCEIWLDNTNHLFPGTFVHVTLHLKMSTYPVVPSAALLLHDNKSSLAVVRDDQVHFVVVKPGLDDGHTVQIKEGIEPGVKVALDVPAELAEGAAVQAEEKKSPENQQGAAGAKAAGGGSSGGGPPAGKPEKPKSPAEKGSGKLSDDPNAGSK